MPHTDNHSQTAAGIQALPSTALYLEATLSKLDFETSSDLPALNKMIGQPRALSALELGSTIEGHGFNIFAVGLPDSGRFSLIESFMRARAQAQPSPDDWCYVFNFADMRTPTALRLPAGRGVVLRQDVHELVATCLRDVVQAFQSDAYLETRSDLVEMLKNAQQQEFEQLAQAANEENFALAKSPFGFVMMPVREGKPLTPEQIEQLSPDEVESIRAREQALQQKIQEALGRLRDLAAEVHAKLNELNERIAAFVITPLVEALRPRYADLPGVLAYLDAVKTDLIAHAQRLQEREDDHRGEEAVSAANNKLSGWTKRYEVNVLVNRTETEHAPVVIEHHPTYYNLIGRVEHEVTQSGAQTDFTMIRAGALHRANGGYLIVPARDLISQPFAWDGLKRALRSGEVRITEPGRDLSLLSVATLEPEPIPIRVRVVLVGTPLLYYLLSIYDEDFVKLFKIKAEFTTAMDRTDDAEAEYAWFVKSVVDQNHLLPFNRPAIGRIIEYGARLAEDQHRLTTRFGHLNNLILEADYWARSSGQSLVDDTAIQRAIDAHIYRSNLYEERLHDMIGEGIRLIDLDGAAVGQINALSVALLGDYAFGIPTRITAAARPGRAGVIDVERQAEMGGPIHTKGVLILEGYLGAHYGRQHALALSASLAFEQSYEGVEGDSASAAELIALLSAIADVPLRQDIAITGSVNQHGQLQAIGGVNEKIEGFYAACARAGLTGTQGVIIPPSNARHLMLRREVVAAVDAGRFHVWTCASINDAIALLTGMEPGSVRTDGSYPEGTFNHAVMLRLAEFAHTVAQAARESTAAALNSSRDS